jgi:uncharacterized protein (DUF1800 family)
MAVWNYENAAHLLGRVGFGGTPDDVQKFLDSHATVESAVDEMLAFKTKPKKPPAKANDDNDNLAKIQRWWLKKMIKAKKPADQCYEKLILFFHNFLVSGASKQRDYRLLAYQHRLFRTQVNGNFREFLREFNRDGANLYYLDGILNNYSKAKNLGGGVRVVNANENFGREVLELFSLGPFQFLSDGQDDPGKPNYTEDDVHQLSRALSGWTEVGEDGIGIWHMANWDNGRGDDSSPPDGVSDDVVIFGVTNNDFRIDETAIGTNPNDDVLELIFSQLDDAGNNQTAMFVARKFWEWYAYPAPAAGLKTLLEGFASVFVANDFDLLPLMREIFTHDEFYSEAAKTRTVKTPAEFVISAYKALNIRHNAKGIGDDDTELAERLEDMGMVLYEPPNVAGWPGGTAWISSSTLLNRLDFIKEVGGSDKGSARIRGKKLKSLVFGGMRSAGDVVDDVLTQLGLDVGPIQLTQLQKDTLVRFLAGQDEVDVPNTGFMLDLTNDKTDDFYDKVRGVIVLAIQTAEFNVH